MPNWTNWVQLVSGLAGIISALAAVYTLAQASNTSRMKATLDMAMPFVRALALSLGKPDILTAYESEVATAKGILRKRRISAFVRTGFAALAVVVCVLLILFPPKLNNGLRFSVGDAAKQECNNYGLGQQSHTECTNHWSLGSSGQKIRAQATLQGPARETDLDIIVDGCSGRAQVRWELLADGESLGNGTAGSERPEQKLTVPTRKSSFTIRAERVDDNSCSAELIVKVSIWH